MRGNPFCFVELNIFVGKQRLRTRHIETKLLRAIPSADIAADNFIKKGLFPDNPDRGQ